MSMLVVLSGFLTIVVVGSALVAIHDLLERWLANRVPGARGAEPRTARMLAGRGQSHRNPSWRPVGRRRMPREVVVVHTGRVRAVDA